MRICAIFIHDRLDSLNFIFRETNTSIWFKCTGRKLRTNWREYVGKSSSCSTTTYWNSLSMLREMSSSGRWKVTTIDTLENSSCRTSASKLSIRRKTPTNTRRKRLKSWRPRIQSGWASLWTTLCSSTRSWARQTWPASWPRPLLTTQYRTWRTLRRRSIGTLRP